MSNQEEVEQMRLITVIDQVAEPIVITDVDGIIEYVNPAFESVTGYTRDDVLGKNPRILKTCRQDAAFYQTMWATLLRGEVWRGRFINQKKDGTFYTGDTTISPVKDADGKTINYVAVKRDVTEETRREDQLRQSQKMQSIGQLVGGVAHDFNNLLQVISGYTQLALEQVGHGSDAIESLDEVSKAGERAKELVRHLLAFSHQQVIDPMDIDLNQAVESTQKMLGHIMGEHIELKVILEENIGLIFADRAQIHQVLMNLCMNAHEAMHHGGTLTIETRNRVVGSEHFEECGVSHPGYYVELLITDTGAGMDPATCEKIFDPFFTTKDEGEGTGLGLSSVYGIVKQNEGHIDVRSELGQGTVFDIYFPVSHPMLVPASQSIWPPVPDETGAVGTILVVEDEQMILDLATQILKDAGYTVLTATNGMEAVQVFEEHADDIDLVVIDVVMPRMGGAEAIKRLLKIRPALRYLFVSGYGLDAKSNEDIKKQRGVLLRKPYTVDAFLRKIREVLSD